MKDFKERLVEDIESCKQSILLMEKDILKFQDFINEANMSISYYNIIINLYKDKLLELRKAECE